MRTMLLILFMAFAANTCPAKLVCDEVVSKYGTIEKRNCQWVPGIEPYYGPTAREGDARRVEKHADGSVTVERHGRDGETEEWRETSPGEWKRFR